jgi:hypothetical protein
MPRQRALPATPAEGLRRKYIAAAPHAGAHTEPRFVQKNQIKSTNNVALHFRKNASPHQTKSMAYATTSRANCKRWV